MAEQESTVIKQMTAAEMSAAERQAGLSISSLEDPQAPKVDLLSALAWVAARRHEPGLEFAEFQQRHTLDELMEHLGLGDDTDQEDQSVGSGAAVRGLHRAG